MRELSIFVDESGSDGLSDRHYLLTAIKYAEHIATATDEKFFGKWSDFKKGILKETRKKLI